MTVGEDSVQLYKKRKNHCFLVVAAILFFSGKIIIT